MNKRKGIAVFLIFVILSWMAYSSNDLLWASSRGPSSCEKCHTDDTVLKTLYKPPKAEGAAPVEEGEG